MPEMPWYEAVDFIRPYVFRIATPRGSGTGFLISRSAKTNIIVIATAAHVVNQAHFWEEPVRLIHASSGQSVIVRHGQRAVFLDALRDTAAMVFGRGDLPVPDQPLNLAPKGQHLRVGNDLGWLGFPAISTELCFFGGRISSWLDEDGAYLVDGVAINGVSGGPAFNTMDKEPWIVGVVSAYVPNRATGEVLPGLAVVRDVEQFHDLAPAFASLDEAQSQQTPPTAAAQSAPVQELPDTTLAKRAT